MSTPAPWARPRTAGRPAPSLRRLARLLAVAALALLTVVAPLSRPAYADPTEPASDPGLRQTVTSDEVNAEGAAVVERGHVDLGPRMVDGQWRVLARDDSGSTPVWRDPASLVMRVTDDALMDAPTDAAYSFLGAKAGERYYVVPQTQNPSVIWLGWNTQDPAVTRLVDRGVTMSIGPVQGPGKSWLFLQNGVFGEPLLLVDGQKPTAQDVWVDVNTHVHANWVFSKPGIYLARATFSADTLDGRHVTASAILRFAVGSATDPSAALAAQPSFAPTPSANETGGAATASGAPDEAAASAQGTAEPSGTSGGGMSGTTTAVVASLAVLALAGGAGLALRRRRLIAAEERRAREEAAGSVVGEAATGGPDAPDAAGAGEGR